MCGILTFWASFGALGHLFTYFSGLGTDGDGLLSDFGGWSGFFLFLTNKGLGSG